VAEQEELLMTAADRDRLTALKEVKKGRITQRQAAEELKITDRQVRRLLVAMRERGDKGILHGLRGRESNGRIEAEVHAGAIAILSQEVYCGFGPTLASEYLASKHEITVSKETVRKWMSAAGLWHARKQRVEEIRQWRARCERFGELVQWDTSDHDWTEGRGEPMYLINMIDDATSRLFARFVRHDSTEENMAVLEEYIRRYGRPLDFYTDKASIFVTTPKKNHPEREEPLPPTQIGRALGELNIGWIGAHSPQAKGRVERSFDTAQDRLVKGMRVAGIKTVEQANAYLEAEYLPMWQEKFVVVPRSSADAHRPLAKEHRLEAILCRVEERIVTADYTFRFDSKVYQIGRDDIRPRLRKARVRVEERRNGAIAVRFEDSYLAVHLCHPAAKAEAKQPVTGVKARKGPNAGGKSQWMQGFWEQPAPSLRKAIAIANATS
jgi:hypothetical protein